MKFSLKKFNKLKIFKIFIKFNFLNYNKYYFFIKKNNKPLSFELETLLKDYYRYNVPEKYH